MAAVTPALSLASADEPGNEPVVELPLEDEQAVQRQAYEQLNRQNPYAITPHRANYLLPFTWSHRPNGLAPGIPSGEQDKFEVAFQLSFKVALCEDCFDYPLDLHFAYTGRSFWQAYNDDHSSPFRDTNHEPEIFLGYRPQQGWALQRDLRFQLGFSHQSNGQSLPLSRSWNRLYGTVGFRWHRVFVDLKAWYRIPEDRKRSPDDAEGDDNPDIHDYLGYSELQLAYVYRNQSVTALWRNNLDFSDNRGALDVSYAFPLNERLRAYVAFFTGYGETLLDYDRSTERISIGLALNHWP